MKDAILQALPAHHPWRDSIHWFDTVTSTNDLARQLGRQGAPEGTVLIAGHQTGGRGRMGRSFHSPEGMGIYLTVILRPACAPDALMHLTCAAAEAACNAVELSAGIRPGIKWINDLVWEKRKIGGILTELVLTPRGTLDSAIIGIGINCCQKATDFPDDIREIASSLAIATGSVPDRAALAAALIREFCAMSSHLLSGQTEMLERYRRDCVTLGKEVVLIRGDQRRYGTAMDLDSCGSLILRFPDGTAETVNSGEVSIRGMYGYV